MSLSDESTRVCLGGAKNPQPSGTPGVDKMVNGLADTLGEKTCNTLDAAAQAKTLLGNVATNIAVSSGCETTAILANIASSYVGTAACVLQSSAQESSMINTTTMSQNIKFESIRGCGETVFSQRLEKSVTMSSKMTEKMENNMKSLVSNLMDTIVESVQDTDKGIGSTMPSSSSVGVTDSSSLSTQQMNTIMTSVKKSYTETVAELKQVVNVGSHVCAPGGKLIVSQDAIITIIASNIIGAAMSSIMEMSQLAEVKSSISSKQTTKTEGFKLSDYSPLLGIGILIIFVAIAYMYFKSKKS